MQHPSFDRTYEGLKLRPLRRPGVSAYPFDRTYEGLKRSNDRQGASSQGAFDRTYEGLKHRERGRRCGEIVLLTVPMRV